jgi:hypothetical protein
MRFLSRLTGLFVSLCLAAFIVVASGSMCITTSGSGAMAKMGMSPSHASDQTPAQDHTPAQRPALPCKFPQAPDGCQSMAPCTSAALASSAFRLGNTASLEKLLVADLPHAPAAVTKAPELPPPRA